jgi:hypothetical protein
MQAGLCALLACAALSAQPTVPPPAAAAVPAGTATKPKAGRQLQELLASSSRVHKRCYPMCAKCRTILGTMLCGLEGQA